MPYTAPQLFIFDIGSSHEIGVATQQENGDTVYTFASWSDGGDSTHAVVLPDTNVTYTASFVTMITGIEDGPVPMAAALYQNVPNPFNPVTTISFDLPHAVHVRLCVYNVKGELVSTIVDRHMAGGHKEVIWSAQDNRSRAVSSGVYFYRLVAGDFVQTRKMVLLR